MSLVRTIIRLRFSLTSREAATRLLESERDRTLEVARRLGEEGCRKTATVPAILGVDEDMRDWSIYQVLEHDTIVNRRLTGQMLFVAGAGPGPDPDFSIKHDVMPSPDPGPEQVVSSSDRSPITSRPSPRSRNSGGRGRRIIQSSGPSMPTGGTACSAFTCRSTGSRPRPSPGSSKRSETCAFGIRWQRSAEKPGW